MSSVIISGDVSGTVTLQAPSAAGSTVLTLPSASGNLVATGTSGQVTQSMLAANVAGNGPAFSAYQSSVQTFSNGTFTKINFQTEEFDTNNNFASSTFTPTVAGYYQISGGIYMGTTLGFVLVIAYKNGSAYKRLTGSSTPVNGTNTYGSCLVYCNGSTDYIELYGYQNSGTSATVPFAQSDLIYFQGALVRAA